MESKKENNDIKKTIINLYNKIKNGISKEKIDNISYYKDLTLIQPKEGIGLAEQDVYVAALTNEQNEKKLKLFSNEKNIANTDKLGKLYFSDEYKKEIEKINKSFALMIEKNDKKEMLKLPGKLSEKDLLLTSAEIEKIKSKEENKVNKDIEENEVPDEGTNKKEKEIRKVSKLTGQSVDSINSCSTINPTERVTDKDTFEDIAGVKGKYSKVYVVGNNNKKNDKRFSLIGITQDGKAENVQGLQSRGATTTDKKIYSINRDGSVVTEKQTTEMFCTKDPNKLFSVTMGQYGVLDVDYIRRDPEKNKFIGSPVATDHERPTTIQVKEFMNTSRTTNNELDKSITKAEEQTEENEHRRTNLNNIDNNELNDKGYDLDEEIKLHNGEITTLRKEAIKMNISPDEYINKIEYAKGDCTPEKINSVNAEATKTKEENIEDRCQEEHLGREERLTPAEIAELKLENHKNEEN